MHLEVIVPTYNRSDLLPVCLKSLQAANIPRGMTIGITVVDNNSDDDTREIVASWKENFNGRLRYVFEKIQGRSAALNAGISASEGDLIGFIDDDEEIDETWYRIAYDAFTTNDVDFIGGPYLPKWEEQ